MKKIIFSLPLLAFTAIAFSQGLHFSQYYNTPLLVNPASTAFLQNNDFRISTHYRNQWSTLPVPFNTFAACADFGVLRNRWETSWLGIGGALWRDVAGNGNLALTKIQGSLAYHVLTSDQTSLSAGLSYAHNQRSIDLSRLTFDVQWDEFTFNRNISNGESGYSQKTTFSDLNAGVNFAYFNDDNLYIRVGASAMHINQPTESFFGQNNKRGMRPVGTLEVVYKANDNIIITPSVYYTRQKKASELVGGAMFNINAGEVSLNNTNEVMFGVFYRNKDALIGAAGYKFGNYRVMLSYDHTVSQMAQGNKGIGAFELSLIAMGNYRKMEGPGKTYGCPRF